MGRTRRPFLRVDGNLPSVNGSTMPRRSSRTSSNASNNSKLVNFSDEQFAFLSKKQSGQLIVDDRKTPRISNCAKTYKERNRRTDSKKRPNEESTHYVKNTVEPKDESRLTKASLSESQPEDASARLRGGLEGKESSILSTWGAMQVDVRAYSKSIEHVRRLDMGKLSVSRSKANDHDGNALNLTKEHVASTTYGTPQFLATPHRMDQKQEKQKREATTGYNEDAMAKRHCRVQPPYVPDRSSQLRTNKPHDHPNASLEDDAMDITSDESSFDLSPQSVPSPYETLLRSPAIYERDALKGHQCSSLHKNRSASEVTTKRIESVPLGTQPKQASSSFHSSWNNPSVMQAMLASKPEISSSIVLPPVGVVVHGHDETMSLEASEITFELGNTDQGDPTVVGTRTDMSAQVSDARQEMTHTPELRDSPHSPTQGDPPIRSKKTNDAVSKHEPNVDSTILPSATVTNNDSPIVGSTKNTRQVTSTVDSSELAHQLSTSWFVGESTVKRSWDQAPISSEIEIWTAERAGVVNLAPVFILRDGRKYRHPPLPPGWSLAVSTSKNLPYYYHPDFGSSFYPPVTLPSLSGEVVGTTRSPIHASPMFCKPSEKLAGNKVGSNSLSDKVKTPPGRSTVKFTYFENPSDKSVIFKTPSVTNASRSCCGKAASSPHSTTSTEKTSPTATSTIADSPSIESSIPSPVQQAETSSRMSEEPVARKPLENASSEYVTECTTTLRHKKKVETLSGKRSEDGSFHGIPEGLPFEIKIPVSSKNLKILECQPQLDFSNEDDDIQGGPLLPLNAHVSKNLSHEKVVRTSSADTDDKVSSESFDRTLTKCSPRSITFSGKTSVQSALFHNQVQEYGTPLYPFVRERSQQDHPRSGEGLSRNLTSRSDCQEDGHFSPQASSGIDDDYEPFAGHDDEFGSSDGVHRTMSAARVIIHSIDGSDLDDHSIAHIEEHSGVTSAQKLHSRTQIVEDQVSELGGEGASTTIDPRFREEVSNLTSLLRRISSRVANPPMPLCCLQNLELYPRSKMNKKKLNKFSRRKRNNYGTI